MTQRVQRAPGYATASNSLAHSRLPAFHPLPESQPVLPCLLRRLLQQGKASAAAQLARHHATAPHFARSLEWLLFTALEANSALAGSPANKRWALGLALSLAA